MPNTFKMTAQSTGGITRRTRQTNARFMATLNFLVPCAHVCLRSGKCWVCSVTVKRPELFLAVYTLQGSRNVGQFTPARHRQFLPESMQPSNCCLNRKGHNPSRELVYNISISKSSANIYALQHERPSGMEVFVWGCLSRQRGETGLPHDTQGSLPSFLT